jgi:putative ABC transport system permease protein
VKADVKRALNRVRRIKDSNDEDYGIISQTDALKQFGQFINILTFVFGGVAAISLLVGGIGIMNIMLVSVTERTREIGLRQAVGAAPRDIQVQFLSEALMLSLIGGVIGVLVGVGGAYLFGALSGMRTVLASYSIIISFTSAALIGIFFGYFPAQKAAQLDPIEALRHE